MQPRQLVLISPEYAKELATELPFLGLKPLYSTPTQYGLAEDAIEPAWAQCVWRDVRMIEVSSITDAQAKLKALSSSWWYHGDLLHRRGALIAEKLNIVPQPEFYKFPPSREKKPAPPSFTMAESGLIYYSHSVQRATPDGLMTFKENRATPPSRAYLKLWEALTVLGDWPRKGESVVDLGACPGSWSWALAVLSTQVLSIDRAPLDPSLARYENIRFQVGDAFSLRPQKMDWVFSDVICFPEKLLEYVSEWQDSGLCDKFVCSVKFHGRPDPRLIDEFRRRPHSRIIHLRHNKNELTWISHPKIPTCAP